MTSVRDIARLTNVSASTVSKVINGRPGVNAETAKAVRRALESTNYQPAFKAVNWNRILVVTPDYPAILTNNTYISTILTGAIEQAYDMGISVSVKKLPHHVKTVTDMKHLLLQDGSAGVLLLALRDGQQFANLLGVENLPHVIVGETVHQYDVNQIVLDNTQSAAKAMSYLIHQGHQRVGIILAHHKEIGQLQRFNACKQTFQQMLGNKGKLYDVSCLSSDIELGRQAFCDLYNRPDPPTAIFCFNHTAAISVLQEATHQGIKIPQQLSLVSYVNDGTQIMLDKPMTSLWVPTHEMGRQAVCLLHQQLSQKSSKGASLKDAPRHQTTLMLSSRWDAGATTAPPQKNKRPDSAAQTIMEVSTI